MENEGTWNLVYFFPPYRIDNGVISAEFQIIHRNHPLRRVAMSPTPPTLNPSQTVERIREIIVGRHLERLEGRITLLESAAETVEEGPACLDRLEDRMLVSEARVEAL